MTHCENTIKEGELLKDNGLIKKIFTTDSIYSLDEEKVEVVTQNEIFSELEKAWNKNPELRFGQLIVNVLGEDPFYMSNKEALAKMKEYVEK